MKELVQDKGKGNFCDEFDFADERGPAKRDAHYDKSKDTWKKLFGE
ncbi:MAG: hypothetical protein HY801_06055 [Candidatus Lindowbacteria bacterium]|nr:hypothetical protein [Candidatus Lindowbacteria bacterium]